MCGGQNMCCGWLSWLAGVSLFKAPCRCTQAPCQQVRSHENHIPNPICPRSYKTSDSRNARKTFAEKKNTFAKSIAELSRGIMDGTKWSSPSYCKARTFRSTLTSICENACLAVTLPEQVCSPCYRNLKIPKRSHLEFLTH